jgi:RND family efflux transporter MFP subunit
MNTSRLLAPVVLLTAIGCAKHPHTLPDQTAAVQASVITVSSSSVPIGVTLTGTVASRQVANVSSQVMAPVSQIAVKEGDHVAKGQILVRLSSATLAAGVQQAQSQVAAAGEQATAAAAHEKLAADTLSRYQTLNQRHSVTPHEFDQVKIAFEAAQAQHQAAAAQVQAAKAAAAQSRATEAFTIIRAPFSGLVTAKYVNSGALAAPGAPLLRIEDTQQLELDIQMNESSMSRLHVGDPVQVTLRGAPAFTARVREVVPVADPAAHTVTVKIGLTPTQQMVSGMTASVLVPTGEGNAITIPQSSVRSRGQMDSVLALDNNSVAQLRYVQLGPAVGDRVQVTSGVEAGDRILARPDDVFIGRRIEQQR